MACDTDRMGRAECPDCRAECTFKFSLLAEGGVIVHFTTCSKCKDHKTIRGFTRLRPLLTHIPASPTVVRRLRS